MREYVGGFFERNEQLTEEVLRDMLMMDMTADAREAKQMALNREREISRCATHRFVVQETGEGGCVYAHPLDSDGRRQSGYPFRADTSKGGLIYDEIGRAHVLVQRWYDGGPATASAVILDMPEKVAQTISSYFDEAHQRDIADEVAGLRGKALREWRRQLMRQVKWEKSRVAKMKKDMLKLATKAGSTHDVAKDAVGHG